MQNVFLNSFILNALKILMILPASLKGLLEAFAVLEIS